MQIIKVLEQLDAKSIYMTPTSPSVHVDPKYEIFAKEETDAIRTLSPRAHLISINGKYSDTEITNNEASKKASTGEINNI